MKTFVLNRIKDISGISGTGIVAEGVIFSNGKVFVHWLKEPQSIVHWNSIQDLEKINGHNGNTIIVYSKNEPEHSQNEKTIKSQSIRDLKGIRNETEPLFDSV